MDVIEPVVGVGVDEAPPVEPAVIDPMDTALQ
jgi:hypothetical protein